VEFGLILEIALLVMVIALFVMVIILLSKNTQGSQSQERVIQKLTDYDTRLDRNESNLRSELEMKFGQNRTDLTTSLKSISDQFSTTLANFTGLVDKKMTAMQGFLDSGLMNNREELNKSITAFKDGVTNSISGFSEILNKELKSVQDRVYNSTKESREELSTSLKDFEVKSSARIESLTKDTKDGLEKSREAVDKRLAEIQQGNEKKLEEMRKTVDEKLHDTLEKRLGESFKQVSEHLKSVQEGLGEMKILASDVGDLKKVMSNVKTKGVLGEYQLEAILEEVLSPGQYDKNVKTKSGSNDLVEFAIKIPSKDDTDKTAWLPIDAKLPTIGYETLVDAYESGDKIAVEKARKEFSRTVKSFAKTINEKYIDPPNTTDFAILFLPFEGAYAEVVRDPDLFESVQREYKIIVTGPSTIAAFLNALQIGFRSLVVGKRTSLILNTLGAVKKEFGNFGVILENVKTQIDGASKTLEEKVGTRTRVINRAFDKLEKAEALPDDTTLGQKVLSDAASDLDDIN
jgi:DNA recombination protein RmuC